MAKPSEKLAESLEILHQLQEQGTVANTLALQITLSSL